MSNKNVVPEAKEALNRFKMEAASDVGVQKPQKTKIRKCCAKNSRFILIKHFELHLIKPKIKYCIHRKAA